MALRAHGEGDDEGAGCQGGVSGVDVDLVGLVLFWECDSRARTSGPPDLSSCPPPWLPSPSSLFEMGKRQLMTTTWRQLHYTAEGFDWQPLFDRLDASSPTISIRALAAEQSIPHNTLSRHYKMYEDGLDNNDAEKMAVATGVIDGRRDNARKFSRAEEETLLRAMAKENVHPSKPHVRLLAKRIHEENQLHDTPARNTRGKSGPVTEFSAGSNFVQRINDVYSFNDHQPKLVKRREKKENCTKEEEDALAAISREEVAQAVTHRTGALAINVDEISGNNLI